MVDLFRIILLNLPEHLCYINPMAVEEYNSMASYYDIVLEPILWKMRRKIIKTSNIYRGMKILEVACGTGTQAVRFKKAGAEYTGVDLSPAMLNVAEKKSWNAFMQMALSFPWKIIPLIYLLLLLPCMKLIPPLVSR